MPPRPIRGAIKINTEGFEGDAALEAAASNKDMKRSDGTGGSKFGRDGGGATTSDKMIVKPPVRYPILPVEQTERFQQFVRSAAGTTPAPSAAEDKGKPERVREEERARRDEEKREAVRMSAISAKARTLSSRFHFSGFYLKPAVAPSVAAAMAGTASNSAEVDRYSDRYRLLEGKRDLLRDELPKLSETIFPKELVRFAERARKKTRGSVTSVNLESARFEKLSGNDAIRLDEDGLPVSSFNDFMADVDDSQLASSVPVEGAAGPPVVGADGKPVTKTADDDDEEEKKNADGEAEVEGNEGSEEEDGGDYTEYGVDDDEDGKDAYGDDDGPSM